MRPLLVRAGLTPALVVVLSLPVAGQSRVANQAAARWYDAYNQGLAAVRKGDWTTAEKQLVQARSTGPKPGRRVFTYGDTYIAFLPDYYLGVVYLNTNRAPQAEKSFETVRSQGIIAARDPEYKAFERQAREATFNRAFPEAVQLVAKGDLTQATALLNQARATNVDDAKVKALSGEISQQLARAQTAKQPADKALPDQVQTLPSPTPVQMNPSSTGAGNVQKTYKPPLSSNPLNAPRGNETFANKGVVVPPKAPDKNATRADKGVIDPPTQRYTSPALRNGLLAFFSGDYRRAIPLLESALQEPGRPPRALVFLACAKTGLVLTGGADAALLREARADFQSIDLMRNFTADERRYISPKLLEQLERQ